MIHTLKIIQQNTRKSITCVNEVKHNANIKADIILIQEPYILNQKVIYDCRLRIYQVSPTSLNQHIYTATIITNPNLVISPIQQYTNSNCTTIAVTCEHRSIVIANCYFSPNKLTDANVDMLNNLSNTCPSTPLIICGDINSRSPI